MSKATTLNRRDDAFCKLVAREREAPGFSYAHSRNREYKGFNDDLAAQRLLKSEDIQQAISTYKSHIIMKEVAGRLESLTTLTKILRAPGPTEIRMKIMELLSQNLEPEVFKSHLSKIDFSGIKSDKERKGERSFEGYDKVRVAAEIMRLSGVDVSKPISDEGKRIIRETLTDIYRDMGDDGSD